MGTGTSDVFSCFLPLLFDSRGRSYFHFLGWFCSFELLTTFPFALKESGLTVPRFGRPNLHRCPLLPGPASSPCVCWPGSGHPEPLAGPTPALLGHPLDHAHAPSLLMPPSLVCCVRLPPQSWMLHPWGSYSILYLPGRELCLFLLLSAQRGRPVITTRILSNI